MINKNIYQVMISYLIILFAIGGCGDSIGGEFNSPDKNTTNLINPSTITEEHLIQAKQIDDLLRLDNNISSDELFLDLKSIVGSNVKRYEDTFEIKFGEMERPPGWNVFSKETIGKHVMLKSIEEMNSKEFIETLNKKLGNVKENDLLVFIHGYNVSFADAARRTAQLSYDLKFQGVPLTYSWPSLSETEEYLTDEASVQYTVPHLVTFLKDVIDNNKESKNKANIHIVGHSMGSRALSYAIKSYL